MAHLYLQTVLIDLDKNISETESLAAAAEQWVSVAFPRGIPKFSTHHQDIVTSLAFFQAFLAWEAFLEESFTLYLLGKRPPRGPRPQRLGVRPATRKEAVFMVVGDRNYADWTKIDELKRRARKYFRDGQPYIGAFLGHTEFFKELSTLRNAIAHSSAHSHEEFKKLVRSKFRGTFPHKMTVGKFLATTIPGSSPPQSFLEYYLDRVNNIAGQVVPT